MSQTHFWDSLILVKLTLEFFPNIQTKLRECQGYLLEEIRLALNFHSTKHSMEGKALPLKSDAI